jgi:DNA-binding response OmpR family regulator
MNGNKVILLIEDDAKLLNSNRLLLESEGYIVLAAPTLATARKYLKKVAPDTIVLDILLPDGNGLDFLVELRATSAIPVLLLTSLGTESDVIRGLEKGGDDYISKPIIEGVFLTRIKTMLRRAANVPETLSMGALKLNLLSGQAFVDGRDMMLTQKEFNLLSLFAQNENRIMAAEQLYEKVWGQSMADNAKAIKYQVYRLRKKLEGSGYTIAAEYGDGYRFEAE